MKLSITVLCVVFSLFLAGALCQSGDFFGGGGGGGRGGFGGGRGGFGGRRRCPDGRSGVGSCRQWSSRSCGRDYYCYTSRFGGGGGSRRGTCCRRGGGGGIDQCPRPRRCGRGGGFGGGRSCRGDWQCRGREVCCWDSCERMRVCMRPGFGPF